MNSRHAHLSPLNLQRFVTTAHLVIAEEVKAGEKRKPELVTAYRCTECSEIYEYRADAEECCPADEQPQKWCCPLCSEDHSEARQAADCCLWKDYDAPTRWRMADAVEAGSNWAEQLGVQVQTLPLL